MRKTIKHKANKIYEKRENLKNNKQANKSKR